MSKQDQLVEQKVLTFKTLAKHNIEEVSRFIVSNHRGYRKASEEERARLFSLTSSVMVPALHSQWSFGLCQDERLIGVYLQIDLLDYLKISKVLGHQTLGELFSIGDCEEYLQKLEPLAKRGDFIMTIFSVLQQEQSIQRRQITLIHQGFYLMKLGGWKNILFQTDNPIPFLRINAQVVMESRFQNGRVSYLMRLNMETFNPSVSPFQKVYARL